MRAFFTPEQMQHDPLQFMRIGRICEAKDLPERSQVLLNALADCGISPTEPADIGLAPLLAVQAPQYLEYLATAYERWSKLPNAGVEILPNLSPYHNGRIEDDVRAPSRSTSPIAQAGYYLGDLACPIGPHTYRSAVRSAHSAAAAAQAVLDGDAASYALCRPSGHHVHRDRAAGFCYINNAAVAAQKLRSRFERVAVLDVDIHHGDGTQQIFYRRPDVLTVSIHADPADYYPYHTGYADEHGYGVGSGYNLNLPLPHGTGNDAMLANLNQGLKAIQSYAPGALVMSLGFDSHEKDPLSVLKVSTECFRDVGVRVRALGLPAVVVQEGGYAIDEIGACLTAFMRGFLAR